MATTAEKGHFPQKKGPGTILKASAAIAGAAATMAGVGAGMDALNLGPFAGSSPDQGTHDTLPGGMPSATATAEQITDSPTPEPTPAPTPEKPKVVYWSKEQIAQAQQEALTQGKILLTDTWSSIGGTVGVTSNYRGKELLILNNLKNGDTLLSPISGVVSVTAGIGEGENKMRYVNIKSDSDLEIEIGLNFNDEVLVVNGQEVTIGAPIDIISGGLLPRQARFSRSGQAVIGIHNLKDFDLTNTNLNDIIHDPSGAVVAYTP